MEIIVTIGILSLALFGSLGLIITGLGSFTRSTVDLGNDEPTSQTIRKITENIRQAISVSVTNSGNTLNYTLPKMSTSADPVTGEKEYVMPLVSDGVARSYTISGANLVEQPSGRTLLGGLTSRDPDHSSGQFNQTYAPCVSQAAGNRQAITITLISSAMADRRIRFSKQKTTVALQNIR